MKFNLTRSKRKLLGCGVILFVLLLANISRGEAATVTCGDVNDTATIQAALLSGGTVELSGGQCRVSSTLLMATGSTTLYLDANLVSTASPILRLTGQNVGIVGKARRMVISGPGVGISIEKAISIYLDLFQLNTQKTGIVALSGAGLWASRLHLNGSSGARSYAAIFMQWDTAVMNNILSEEHDYGIRFGYGDGNVHNVQLANIIFDRLSSLTGQGLRVEANPGYAIGNIQATNLWASRGYYPVTLVASPGGQIANIQIDNAYFTDFVLQAPTIVGSVLNVQISNVLY